MVEAATVLKEQKPMLAEFLEDLGLSTPGAEPDLQDILPTFDRWLAAQVVSSEDQPYLAARLGAYACLFLTDVHGGSLEVVANRIVVRVPVPSEAARELEPYALAWAWASRRPIDFATQLSALVSPYSSG